MASGTTWYNTSYTIPANQFEREHYTFQNWATQADGGGFTYDAGAVIPSVTANMTLYAIWRIDTSTVTFNANGGTGTMPSGTVDYGTSYAIPDNTFTRTGYTFDHWNTQADDGGTTYSAGSTITNVTANVSLYAIWSLASMTISFNANNGTGTMTNGTVPYGNDYAIPANTFTRTGYTFNHWNTLPGGTGASYPSSGTIATVTADTTLYAIWRINTSTITFNANSGTGTMASATVDYGASYTIPSNTFYRDGYAFLHWNTQANDGGTTYSAGATITNVTANVSLYAIWSLASMTITFDSNSGSGTMPNGTVLYGNDYAIPANTFTRTGYTFDHWNTLPGGTGASYPAGGTITDVYSNMTLYAIWQVTTRTITFNANGGTGTMANGTVNYGSNYTIPVNTTKLPSATSPRTLTCTPSGRSTPTIYRSTPTAAIT